jgi:hypothetical protein
VTVGGLTNHCRRRVGLALCGLVALPGSARAAAPDAAPGASVPTSAAVSPKKGTSRATGKVVGRQVLAVFKAPPYEYELAIPKCTPSKELGTFRGTPRCPFEIRLLESGKAVAVEQLDVASCGPSKPGALNRLMGADLEAAVWVTGYDRCRADVAARAVELAPGVTGLLVTRRSGTEHPTRRHWLLVQRDRKLETVWSADDGGSPNAMSARVLPTSTPHQNDIAFVETYVPPLEAAQSLTAMRLHFQPSTGQIVKSPLPDAKAPLFLLRVGPFHTADDAYEARGHDSCLAPYVVVKPELFSSFSPARVPGSPAGESFLGLLLARKEDAVVAQGDLANCSGGSRPTLSECAAEK